MPGQTQVWIILAIAATANAACSNVWTTIGDDANAGNTKTYTLSLDSSTGVLYRPQHDDYKVSCDCGVISRWRFYARKEGTIVFIVFRQNGGSWDVIGTNSINIPALSKDNHFDVPISLPLRITVQQNDYIAWYTAGDDTITYNVVGTYNVYEKTGLAAAPAVGDSITFGGTSTTNRAYAVGAYIQENYDPMFLNLPYETTMYTDQTAQQVMTLSVHDHEPDDAASLAILEVTTVVGFTFDPVTYVLTYTTEPASAGPYEIAFSVNDICGNAVTATATVTLVNVPPTLTNMPAFGTISEDVTATTTFLAIGATDLGTDTVTCSKQGSIQPTLAALGVTGNEVILTSPSLDFDTAKWYRMRINCADTAGNTIQTGFTLDVTKNTPPAFTNLPGFANIGTTSGATIFTVAVADTDPLTYGITCDGGGACPFSIDGSGNVQTTALISEPGYDLTITADDTHTVVSSKLSVLLTQTPRLNELPTWTNLPTTVHVVEDTAAGTYLYTVGYSDQNQDDTLTLTATYSDADLTTFFSVDLATGVITVNTAVDYETALFAVAGETITFEITDSIDTATATFTIIVDNVNEAPSFTGTPYSCTGNEGQAGATFCTPGIVTADVDSVFTHTVKMNCGTNSKYFHLSNTNDVVLSQELDADAAGAPTTAACTLTVTDEGLLTATADLTLTITNYNDHTPECSKDTFTFFALPTTASGTQLGDVSATDADSADVLSYTLLDSGDTYFSVSASGQLTVISLASFDTGSSTTHRLVASDSSLATTCTVVVLFSGVATTTTTTTERVYRFEEDSGNFSWLVLVGFVVLCTMIAIVVIICRDPGLNDKITEWKNSEQRQERQVRARQLAIEEQTRKQLRQEEKEQQKREKKLEKLRKKDPAVGLPWELLATKKTADVIEEEEEQGTSSKKKNKNQKQKGADR